MSDVAKRPEDDRVDQYIDQASLKTVVANAAIDRIQPLIETLLTDGYADKATLLAPSQH